MQDFKKFDDNKLKYSMLPPESLKAILRVMAFGAQKYGEGNWKLCEDPMRYYNALLRHLEAYRSGERYDPETNYPHLDHMLCNALFLQYLEEGKKKNESFIPGGIVVVSSAQFDCGYAGTSRVS